MIATRPACSETIPWFAIAVVFTCLHCRLAVAQYPTILDPNATGIGRGMLESPEVGYVEGIQRFGESLRTEPDPGVGYTYRIFPSIGKNRAMDEESFLWALAHAPEAFQLKRKYLELGKRLRDRQEAIDDGKPTKEIEKIGDDIRRLELEIAELQLFLQLALGGKQPSGDFSRYARALNTTAGMRNAMSSTLRDSPAVQYGAATAGFVAPLGFGVKETLFKTLADAHMQELYHQPLIQIKVRIVEATRANTSDFRSVLDYISRDGTASLITANNINSNQRSTRAASRFEFLDGVLHESDETGPPSEIGALSAISGSGALVNLTTEHLNLITNMLVRDFSGDVFTVPEVVTLNGQNVEFVAGDKRPFPLGLTLVQGTAQTQQNFFYKHVGTLLSITPRIVNWGKHLEGAGEAPVVAQEIGNWNRLATWMNDERNLYLGGTEDLDENGVPDQKELKDALPRFALSKHPVPFKWKKKMLAELEKYPAMKLRERFYLYDAALYQNQQETTEAIDQAATQNDELPPPLPSAHSLSDSLEEVPAASSKASPTPILRHPFGFACDWKPEDCTIDLEIIVRESKFNLTGADANASENINAIANIVQVKSGHGVVMGGMIGSGEIETVSKIPVLGDLPAVGYAFRSKSTDRAKSELIIFVEATVLPNSHLARDETARDFQLGYGYVHGELRDNAMEIGMHRAGFGHYLPPSCPREDAFWMECGNKMRRVATEVDDIFE